MNTQDTLHLILTMITALVTDQTGNSRQRKVKLDDTVADGDQDNIFVEQCIKFWSDISMKICAESHKNSKREQN